MIPLRPKHAQTPTPNRHFSRPIFISGRGKEKKRKDTDQLIAEDTRMESRGTRKNCVTALMLSQWHYSISWFLPANHLSTYETGVVGPRHKILSFSPP
jgi:hypothetical protein